MMHSNKTMFRSVKKEVVQDRAFSLSPEPPDTSAKRKYNGGEGFEADL